MQFLILLYGDEAAEAALSAEERLAIVDRHREFSKGLGGRMLGGDALEPSATAATIRRGKATDGPFVETKEQLGGYYIVECADRAEAIEVARGVPESPGMVVEVRPLSGM